MQDNDKNENTNGNNDLHLQKKSIFSKSMDLFIKAVFVLLPIWGIIYNLQLYYMAGFMVLRGHYNASMVAAAFVIIFLTIPARKDGKTRQWYDFPLVIATLVFCIYYIVNYMDIVYGAYMRLLPEEFILGIIAILVLLEAVRRTTGWVMVIVSIFFMIHGLFAPSFPGFLRGPSIGVERLVTAAYLSNEGIFGFIIGIATTYIIAFSTFGAFLVIFGGGEKLTNLVLSMVGHIQGGAAKVAVLSSAALGTLTGDAISNVGISGSFTLPMMKKMGFKDYVAGAVETVGSVGGVILPPMMGAIIFIMVEVTGIPYVHIMRAALFPAILYFLAVYFQIDF